MKAAASGQKKYNHRQPSLRIEPSHQTPVLSSGHRSVEQEGSGVRPNAMAISQMA
jgi:hypothetical protein